MMDDKKLHELIEKYFEAELSVNEERMLLGRLLHYDGEDPVVDEALAVMGYARGKTCVTERSIRSWRRKVIYAAAAVAGVVMISLGFFHSGNSIDTIDSCYAYVNGVKIENSVEVTAIIADQLGELSDASENVRDVVAGDLEDMKQALNF